MPHGKLRALESRRHLLPLILMTVGVLLLGCGRPAPLGSPDPTLPAPSAAAEESLETSTPVATAADVSTPVPTDPPPATQTPATRTPATRTPEPTEEPTAPSDLTVSPVVGARAPGLTLPDLDGNEVSLGDLEGNVVLLNFWTTW